MKAGIPLHFLFALLQFTRAVAQENLHFSVDRPGISDLPTTVPVKHLQVETGFEFFQRENYTALFLPTMLLRTGITKSIEARLSTRYLHVDSAKESSADTHNLGLGFDIKARFIQEKGFLPSAALLAGYNYASVASNQREKFEGPYALLLMEDNFHDKVLLNYNFGVIWGGQSSSPTAMYAFCFEVELRQNAAVFIEQSTFFNPDDPNDHWLNLGYTHLAARHSQVDFSMGKNFNGGNDEYFVAVGYSTRLSLE